MEQIPAAHDAEVVVVQRMVEEVEAAQGVECGFWALWEAYARLAWAMLRLEQAVFGSVSGVDG